MHKTFKDMRKGTFLFSAMTKLNHECKRTRGHKPQHLVNANRHYLKSHVGYFLK
ncbi:hypothetical protein R3W88_031820, partial [Solanum pinnatisectum]